MPGAYYTNQSSYSTAGVGMLNAILASSAPSRLCVEIVRTKNAYIMRTLERRGQAREEFTEGEGRRPSTWATCESKCAQNRECEFSTPVISTTYNLNALKYTDFPAPLDLALNLLRAPAARRGDRPHKMGKNGTNHDSHKLRRCATATYDNHPSPCPIFTRMTPILPMLHFLIATIHHYRSRAGKCCNKQRRNGSYLHGPTGVRCPPAGKALLILI